MGFSERESDAEGGDLTRLRGKIGNRGQPGGPARKWQKTPRQVPPGIACQAHRHAPMSAQVTGGDEIVRKRRQSMEKSLGWEEREGSGVVG